MSPGLLLAFVLGYFALLLAVAGWTGRRAGNEAFFIGNRSSHWALVSFGMIGTSLSGVTFISVPGAVSTSGFTYFQIVFGQLFGYWVIAGLLLPLYHRLGVTSIYHVLDVRLGRHSYRTGAAFFILSRTLGATARLYLVVRILQDTMLDQLGVPFWLTTAVILLMILLYTVEGGVKTIVWTDTLQTACMLGGLVVCVAFLLHRMDLGLAQSWAGLRAADLATVLITEPESRLFFVKQIVAGMFIAIAMTGLDQEMMQKTLSVKALPDAQKNVIVLSVVMLVVVMLFLFLGGLLALYARQAGVTASGDRLFPTIVLEHLPAWVQVIFVLALISALFPSADGAITALTSSTCIDLLGLMRRTDLDERGRTRIRHRVHLGFAAVFLLLILAFRWADSPSMILVILKLAGYTYGPLMGLFAFAVLTRRIVADRAVPWIALAAPLLCWVIDANQAALFGRWQIGLELLLLNAALTFAGLWTVSKPAPATVPA